MKTKLSALIDGELDDREMREVCISLRHDDELRRRSSIYMLIGDTLRREPHLSTEITGAVLDHLADEPIVLAPRAIGGSGQGRKEWRRPALAMAATLAGVAVVAWLSLPTPLPRQTVTTTAQGPVVLATANDADMQEYLIAHQIHSGSVYLNGETQHIRTVALSEPERN